jgi:hypothetical protein
MDEVNDYRPSRLAPLDEHASAPETLTWLVNRVAELQETEAGREYLRENSQRFANARRSLIEFISKNRHCIDVHIQACEALPPLH